MEPTPSIGFMAPLPPGYAPQRTYAVGYLLRLYNKIDFKNKNSPFYLEQRVDQINRSAFYQVLSYAAKGIYEANDWDGRTTKTNMSQLSLVLEKIAFIFEMHEDDFALWGPYVRDLAYGVNTNWCPARWLGEANQLESILEVFGYGLEPVTQRVL